MKTYRILVHDIRSRTPIELTAEMSEDARVREFARERLAASDNLESIEVWSGVVKLCHFRSDPARRAA
ncbi:MAG: hypothetical protein ACREEW_03870 [Caulobacteraceae bacterium]